MLYCDVCGKQNQDGSRACDFCGAPLEAASAVPVSAPSSSVAASAQPTTDGSPTPHSALNTPHLNGPICPKCKRTNRSGSVFCAYCGYSLQPGTAPKPYALPFEAPAISAVGMFPNYSIAANVTGNLPSGTVLKRRYRILRKIAQGGMGAVYEGVDTLAGPEPAKDGRRWAIK